MLGRVRGRAGISIPDLSEDRFLPFGDIFRKSCTQFTLIASGHSAFNLVGANMKLSVCSDSEIALMDVTEACTSLPTATSSPCTTFRGRLDSLSQGSASFRVGSGSPWLMGYTDVMQISVDQSIRRRISLSSSKPQPAYDEVSARLHRLSEPSPAAATKRQYYKLLSAANQTLVTLSPDDDKKITKIKDQNHNQPRSSRRLYHWPRQFLRSKFRSEYGARPRDAFGEKCLPSLHTKNTARDNNPPYLQSTARVPVI
ncbi:hypothetical protein B0H14DRAFT_3170164 [Mycena olivaceomarginata]|nr:hypothetical protein B0H14DRAFT_3170164 [Mycena olivaceomarginata]